MSKAARTRGIYYFHVFEIWNRGVARVNMINVGFLEKKRSLRVHRQAVSDFPVRG